MDFNSGQRDDLDSLFPLSQKQTQAAHLFSVQDFWLFFLFFIFL